MLGPTLLLDGLHCADGCGELPSSRAGGAGADASSVPLTSHRGLGVPFLRVAARVEKRGRGRWRWAGAEGGTHGAGGRDADAKDGRQRKE